MSSFFLLQPVHHGWPWNAGGIGVVTVHIFFCRPTWRQQNIYWNSELSNLCILLLGQKAHCNDPERTRKHQYVNNLALAACWNVMKFWMDVIQPMAGIDDQSTTIDRVIYPPTWIGVVYGLRISYAKYKFWQKLQILNPKSKRPHARLPNKERRLNQSKIQNPKSKSKIKTPQSKRRILDFGHANLKLGSELDGFQVLNH